MGPGGTQILLVAVFGVLHLIGHYRGHDGLWRLCKGMPIAVLAMGAALSPAAVAEPYRWAVVLALTASLAGDLFLLTPGGFRRGLASFFVAHLLYVAAFLSGPWAPPPLAWGLGVGLPAALLLARLWGHLGRERVRVAVYVSVIGVMAWTAAGRAEVAVPGAGLALVGAAIFIVSDATLAFDRFVTRFRSAHFVVMVTYYTAQSLLARSVVVP